MNDRWLTDPDYIRSIGQPMILTTNCNIGQQARMVPVDISGHMQPVPVGFIQLDGKEIVAVLDDSTPNDDGTWSTEVWASRKDDPHATQGTKAPQS